MTEKIWSDSASPEEVIAQAHGNYIDFETMWLVAQRLNPSITREEYDAMCRDHEVKKERYERTGQWEPN